MRCSTACGRRSSIRPTSTCRRSTRGSRISSRCSCTSLTPTSSSRRFASPAAASRTGSLLTDIAREFGYARSRTGRADALRSGVDVAGLAAFDSDVLPGKEGGPARLRPEARAARARVGARVGGVRGVHDDRAAQDRALLSHCRPQSRGARPRAAQRRAGESDRAGGVRRRRPVPQHLHPRHRLLSAGRHGARRVPARDHHRRRRPRAHRQVGLPRSADAIVPAPAHLSRPRALHDRGRRPLAATGRTRCTSRGWPSAISSSTATRASRRAPRNWCARRTRSGSS